MEKMSASSLIASFVAVLTISIKTSSQAFPTPDANHIEFLMRQNDRSAMHRYGINSALDMVFKSEDSLGNLTACPAEVKKGANLPAHEKSTCPWYYEIHRSATRYPEVILNAVTPCRNSCIGRDDNYQCHPITRSIHVLHLKGQLNSTYRIYEPEDIDITVGFTCGSRNMAQNAGTESVTPVYDK